MAPKVAAPLPVVIVEKVAFPVESIVAYDGMESETKEATPVELIDATEPTWRAATVADPTQVSDARVVAEKLAAPSADIVAPEPRLLCPNTIRDPTPAALLHVRADTVAPADAVKLVTEVAASVAFPSAVMTPPVPNVVVPDTRSAFEQVIA